MSINYIHFTPEEKEKARNTDLAALLYSQGETLKRSGTEYEWLDGSRKVTVRGNLWYHQYEQTGGDAIAFVQRFYGKNYPEAVEFILNNGSGTIRRAPPIEKPVKEFKLPEGYWNMHRVVDYLLNTRGIDEEVLYDFIGKSMLYESLQYHNAVFIGFNNEGVPCHANKRSIFPGSDYKGNAEGSVPEYSFHRNGTSEKLFVFEAPIDMLSFISMNKENWQKHSYAACCGVGDRVVFRMLKDNPNIKAVILCLDNDIYGRKANERISDKLQQMGIAHRILVPTNKDWNEDLSEQRASKEVNLKENPKENKEADEADEADNERNDEGNEEAEDCKEESEADIECPVL